MAWKARLAADIIPASDRVYAIFEFYDDAVVDGQNKPVIVATESFTFSPGWSTADMQAAVTARGVAIKRAKTRAAELAGQFPPVTTVISIP